MRRICLGTLGLSLGCFLLQARAEELSWRPVGSRPAPVVRGADPGPADADPVAWRTHQPAADPPAGDSGIRPVSFISVPAPLPGLGSADAPSPLRQVTAFEMAQEPPPPAPVSRDPAPPAPSAAGVQAVQFPAEPVAFPGVGGDDGPVPEEAVGGDLFGCCQCCGPWLEVSPEYLLWWTRGDQLPPLVTTGPATVPEAVRGALGAPGTVILFGNQGADEEARSGGRLTATYWCDPGCFGIEASAFLLAEVSTKFSASSDQFAVLARPFFNLNQGIQDRQLAATPGILPTDVLSLRGTVTVDTPSRLWGAEINLRERLCGDCCWHVDILGGFRYLDLQEGLHITENVISERAVAGVPIFNVGNNIIVSDRFDTRNQFYGGQVGTQLSWHRGRWGVDGIFKLGLGLNHEVINIQGNQTVTTPAGSVTQFQGGLLALSSNSGHFTNERFAVVPEVELKVSYQLTEHLSAFLAYDFLYWNGVVRPGDQVDLTLDVNKIPNFSNVVVPNTTGQVHPVVPFRETGFWAQGFSAGVELKY
jgi:hypothetical protein